jgi:hypothetical protein
VTVRDRRHYDLAVRLLPVAAVSVVLIAAGCGSSSKASSSSPTTAVGANDCPFSGSTTAQTTPSGPVPNVQVASASPRRAGCIDQVHFGFRPAVAASQSSYQGNTLRVRFTGASLGSGLASGNYSTKGLAYVKSITVDQSAPKDEVDFLITLDQQRQFLVSSSQAPAEVEIAIG